MTRAWKSWIRVIVVAWAALQMALPSLSSLADARLAAASAGVTTVHVESNSSPACHPVHSADCAFCQFLSTCFSPSRAATPELIVVREFVAPPGELASLAKSAALDRPSSRAPPAV